MQRLLNDRLDGLDLTHDLMVSKTQDAESALFEPSRSTGVSVHLLRVLSTIDFDHELGLQAYKIQDIETVRMLSPKSITLQLAPTQVHPKALLGFAHCFAKLPATLFERWLDASESCRHLKRWTPILAFPLGRGKE